MSVPFRHSKHSGAQEAAPLQRSASKRQAFHSFLKSNASKLRRSGSKKDAAASVKPDHPSNRRKSQMLNIPSVVIESEREPSILTEWKSKSSEIPRDVPRPSKDSVAGHFHTLGRKPSSARAPSSRTSPKPLSEDDITRIFSGAPEFDIISSQKSARPKISYRGKVEEKNGQPCDSVAFAHSTFSAATLDVHEITTPEDAAASSGANPAPLDDDDKLIEIPNMMSLNGSEPGTVGFEYFLQMPMSDSKLSPDEEEDTGSRRQLLATSPDDIGLRPLDLEQLIDRLTELGDARQSDGMNAGEIQGDNEQKITEMHAELFSKLLIAPEINSEEDLIDTSLESQIKALVEVLDAPKVWYDFSLVENRIRLGQLLWPSLDDDEFEPEDPEEEPPVKDRDIVLLQITLASELLVRLELASQNTASTPPSRKIRWDMVLALRFLQNLRIAPKIQAADEKQYRNSVFSIATFVTARESIEETQVEPIIYPRHEKQQLDGLLQFAEAMAWPHREDIKQRFHDRVRRHSSVYDPYATLVQSSNVQGGETVQKRPQVGRTTTAQSVQLLPASAYGSESFDAGGWLSRSWLTGFVLPGESISHLLISTLLENSPPAVQALGDSANLYGGFIYKSRSYWSKSCVVGRVIAAANGATDCMGWISASSAPVSQKDGWVNLEVKDLPTSTTSLPSTNALTTNSAFVKGTKGTTTDAEFTWPVDGLPVLGNETRYHGFTLQPTGTSFELTNNNTGLAPIPTSIACLDFSAKRNSRAAKITLPLLYDVYFISAYPCYPASRRSPQSSRPTSPEASEKELPEPPCHPLHCAYSVEIIPAATILADDFTDTAHLGDETVVLDCRGTGELQLLARAWCAKVGENAVVARVGRTCLGCCVREAQGLGVKVVIRI